jgi:hypothetical protein
VSIPSGESCSRRPRKLDYFFELIHRVEKSMLAWGKALLESSDEFSMTCQDSKYFYEQNSRHSFQASQGDERPCEGHSQTF